VIRAIAFGVVCLAGLGAIGATAKKSASPLSEVFPTVTGNKADRLSFADGRDTLTSADRVDFGYVSPTDQSKLATIQSGNQAKSGLAPSTIVLRHWHDPNAKRSAAMSTDRSIKIQDPKKSKNVDRAKISVDLRPCRRPEGFAGLLRALNLSPGCDT
jgi:hypothetical protein